MLWSGFVVSQVHKLINRGGERKRGKKTTTTWSDFLFKRGVLKVAWFLFLVFFRALMGHKGKKCLSKSRETHAFWVTSSIYNGG
jgi:hypothetical protein